MKSVLSKFGGIGVTVGVMCVVCLAGAVLAVITPPLTTTGKSSSPAEAKATVPAEPSVPLEAVSSHVGAASPRTHMAAQAIAPHSLEAPAPSGEVAAPDIEATLALKFERDLAPDSDARQTEMDLRQRFSEAAVEGASVESLECRATACRARVVFRSIEVDKSFGKKLFLDPTNDLKLDVTIPVRVERPDGSIEATIYLVKPSPVAQMDEATEE